MPKAPAHRAMRAHAPIARNRTETQRNAEFAKITQCHRARVRAGLRVPFRGYAGGVSGDSATWSGRASRRRVPWAVIAVLPL